KHILRAFFKPMILMVVVGATHLAFGKALGFPALVSSEEIYETLTGRILSAVHDISPLFSVMSVAFVVGTVVQEFWRGTAVRMRSKGEGALEALVALTLRAKRRYGGYVVHVGVAIMFIGFTGAAYDVEQEKALRPGETMEVSGYTLRYDGARSLVDPNKRMLFTDLAVLDDGKSIGTATPAKFVYRTHPDMPTTEVDIRSRPGADLYTIMSTVDPETKMATFRVIVRPLVMWIWLGAVLLILGTLLAVSPSVKEVLAERRSPKPVRISRTAVAVATLLLALTAVVAFASGAQAQSDGSSSLHAGSVTIRNPEERKLFERLLCMCGDCQRLTLANCGCGWADNKRAELRQRLASNQDVLAIIASYRDEYGPKSLSVPVDEGLDRALWAVPLGGVVLAAFGVVGVGRRWKRRRGPVPAPGPDVPEASPAAASDAASDDY
ncbi:MAG: cytochrome c-type biogenesis protein CcmH, partial [Myxococcales bacterium]|nr:cytochrome c-type biogenesis protein CcmH [Myxococcales bacterium]